MLFTPVRQQHSYQNLIGVCMQESVTENKCGAVIWICGLAGAGKSTIAQAITQRLSSLYGNVILLDGDEIRAIFGQHKGFDVASRLEISRLIAQLAMFLSQRGLIVIVATVSLFKEIYDFNRANNLHYFEIFIECSKEELLRRDKKALYSRALKGEIQNVVGVDLPYDKPNAHYVIKNEHKAELDSLIARCQTQVEVFLDSINTPLFAKKHSH